MSQNVLPLKIMYNEVNRVYTHGIQGYDVQKKYFDPVEQINQRKYSTIKKGQKSNKYQTKRGSYLTDHANITKNNPAPGQYEIKQQWPKRSKTMRTPTKKKTYLDQIIDYAKKQKFPAPGHYNTIKTQEQIQEQNKKLANIKRGQQTNITYLDTVQYSSEYVPGPGAYNPRQVQSKKKLNPTKPQDWRKKSDQQSRKKLEKVPDMGTYNPIPIYDIFGSPEKKSKDKPNAKANWGKEKRFDLGDPKKSGKGKPPGPGQYTLIHQWKGKDTKISRDYMDITSKHLSKSVYY